MPDFLWRFSKAVFQESKKEKPNYNSITPSTLQITPYLFKDTVEFMHSIGKLEGIVFKTDGSTDLRDMKITKGGYDFIFILANSFEPEMAEEICEEYERKNRELRWANMDQNRANVERKLHDLNELYLKSLKNN